MTNISVAGATSETKSLDLYAKDSLYAIVDADSLGLETSPEIAIDPDLEAPFSEGETVGAVSYTIDGVRYETELLASHTVYRIDYIKILLYVLLAIFLLMVLTALKKVEEKERKRKKHQNMLMNQEKK